jgi:hypothetical protein
MEKGWNRPKILILILIGIGSLSGAIMYVYGFSQWKYKNNPNAFYWIAAGFVLHIFSMGVIPQILKRIWNKKG